MKKVLTILTAMISAIVLHACATGNLPSVASVHHAGQCSEPPEMYEGGDMFIVQGDYYGNLCAAYEGECINIVCRRGCEGEWQFNGRRCPE